MSVLPRYLSLVHGNTSSPMVFPSPDLRMTVGSGGGLNWLFTMHITHSRLRASVKPSLSTGMLADERTLASSSRRIPSQTPAAIWAATGINLVRELVEITLGRGLGERSGDRPIRSSAYFHLVYSHGVLSTCGEKEFSHVERPHMANGLFGTDEAITDYEPGRDEWRGTFIVRGGSRIDVLSRFDETVFKIMEVCGATRFVNRSPEVI